MTKGLVHLYIGGGKGKTTAAVGLAVRMAGTGGRVLFLQFLKGADTGELTGLEQLGIQVLRTGKVKKFVSKMTLAEREDCHTQCEQCFAAACEALTSGSWDLVVLDEVLDAVNCGMVDQTALVSAVSSRSETTEVVITGRNPCDELVELADYISEMQCIKHPYQRGIVARRGIEY